MLPACKLPRQPDLEQSLTLIQSEQNSMNRPTGDSHFGLSSYSSVLARDDGRTGMAANG